MEKDNIYYRKEAMSLQREIEEARFFLSHHKPSLGFWGEHLLRGFLRANLRSNIRVSQGFILLDEKAGSTIQNLYYLINEKVEGIEHVFSDSISPQCDIIIFTGKPVKTFGEIVIVNSEDVIAVIEVKCSIDRKKFENTLVNFRKLAHMGVRNKYLFIYNSCSLRSIHSYFYPQNGKDEIAIAQIFDSLYDHGDETWLPNAVVGVNKNYCLCQNYVISDRDQFGYTFYRLKNDAENISCLQLFLSHLFRNIDSMCKGGNSFDIDFNTMIDEYSFGLYDL